MTPLLQSEAAEIKVSDDPTDPTISIQLSGVDVESIVDAARNVDTDGERRRRVRTMVLDGLGITKSDTMFIEYATVWRGTPRSTTLGFKSTTSTTATCGSAGLRRHRSRCGGKDRRPFS